ncbi:MAG: site-specific integrase [Acidimicrobiales bacterium]
MTVGRDPLTGRRDQITRRGFRTATEAAKARRQVEAGIDSGRLKPSPAGMTVNELMELYLEGLEDDQRLSVKTRHDYRVLAETYVKESIGRLKVRDVTPEAVLSWQRKLRRRSDGEPLAPNTVRLARAPLAGAFKLAVSLGMVALNPVAGAPRPKPRRSIPRHWTPEQARDFLSLMEGDRTYPIWAFLLGSGLRIGELVWLRWSNVDLEAGLVRVVDFATYAGHGLVASEGKSRDAVRSIDLDPGLIGVLALQRRLQAEERLAAAEYESSDYVFTNRLGKPYHPQFLSRTLGNYTQELGLPRLTAHGLRHTCATLMLANGVPPKVAAERLGHADATLFTNLYSHVTPTMQKEAAAKIGAALFG